MARSIQTDRFGRPYQVVGCTDKKETGFSKGYVDLGGKTYLLEPSDSQKEGVEMWIRVTKVDKKKKQTSM